MASVGHFAQSYITNLYDKQKKRKIASRLGGGGGARAPRSYATATKQWAYLVNERCVLVYSAQNITIITGKIKPNNRHQHHCHLSYSNV